MTANVAKIQQKYLNSGASNGNFINCIGMTYYHGQLVIAYGSSHLVVIASTSLNVISTLDGHSANSVVTCVAWAPFSGRLSSCSNNRELIIWDPVDRTWRQSHKIILSSPGVCMSWSITDVQFCVAADKFQIYTLVKNIEAKEYEPIFEDPAPISFCSFSRDSRFILTLQKSSREVFIWHKIPNDRQRLRRIPLNHPSPVITIHWRTSDQIHERCSFLTLAEDHVVRIWTETGVNEELSFNVVAAIPSEYQTISATFLTTSSRMIKNNACDPQHRRTISVDNYAYGTGHLPLCDLNNRVADVASNQELKRNVSWLLTCDQNNCINLWELSGISTSVRRTPKLNRIKVIECSGQIFPGNYTKIFAVCTLENELAYLNDENFIGRPSSISLILQDQKTNMIENVDISLQKDQVQVVGRSQGHSHPINSIRIHQTKPLMVTIDTDGLALIWKYDDTDVFDPTVLTKFGSKVDSKVIAGDWNGIDRQLFGFNGNSFLCVDVPVDAPPNLKAKVIGNSPKIYDLDNGGIINEVMDFRYCTTMNCGSLFIMLLQNALYILYFDNKREDVVLLKKFTSRYTFGAQAYISTLFPLPGATIYFFADANNDVYTTIMENTSPFQVSVQKVCHIDEDVVALDFAHPGFLFIITKKHMLITWRHSSQKVDFEPIQSIEMSHEPIFAACIPTGLIAVVSRDEVHTGKTFLNLYHSIRQRSTFPDTHSDWEHVASCEMDCINAIEWSLDGILIVASGTKITAFTKFMDSFFFSIQLKKVRTIHHALAIRARSPSDFHPMTMFPLASSGRLNLVFSMLEFLNENYNHHDNLGMYTKNLLKMPEEGFDNAIPEDKIDAITEPLLIKLQLELPLDCGEKQRDQLMRLVKMLKQLQRPDIMALEKRAQVVARACLLEERAIIPFDAIILAYQTYAQMQLMKTLDLNSWENVEKSGCVFWCKNLKDIFEFLTPLAVNVFENSRYLSILILVLGKRQKILQRLFSKAGDDTRAQFFVRNFNLDKNQKSAEKNAYSALSKHDYHIAAAMFFLAGQIGSCVRVLLKNLGSYTLAYLACRCLDEGDQLQGEFEIGENTKRVINEAFIPRAIETKDLAAKELFEHIIDPSNPIELAPRMTQPVPGFFFEESAYYGDMRFNLCEALTTSISMKSDYIKSAFYMGNLLLAVQYLPYYSDTILPIEATEYQEGPEVMQMQRSRSRDFGENFLGAVSAQPSSGDIKFSKSFHSFTQNSLPKIKPGKKGKSSSSDYSDDDDTITSDNVMKRSGQLSHKKGKNSLLISPPKDHKAPPAKKHHHKKSDSKAPPKPEPKPEPEEDKSAIDNMSTFVEEKGSESESDSFDDNPFGFTGNMMDDFDTEEYSDESEDEDTKKEDDKKKSEYDSEYSYYSDYYYEEDENEPKEEEKKEDEEQIESALVDNWFNEIILFNICRYRLEYFLETKYGLDLKDVPNIFQILPEINSVGDQTKSMAHQLSDYLLRSCKRRCFIYRRIMLMTSEIDKLCYIHHLCRSISLIPDQMLSFHISPQQISQLAQTAHIIIMFINAGIVDISNCESSHFIIASICTALFMFAFFYQKNKMMHMLLSLDLKTLKRFPDEFDEELTIVNVQLEEIQNEQLEDTQNGSFLTYILENSESKITCKSAVIEDEAGYINFTHSLLDFLLHDTFLSNIQRLYSNTEEFEKMFQFLSKIRDIYMQLFQYHVLSSNVVRWLPAFTAIDYGNDEVNKLYELLLTASRQTELNNFAKYLVNKFSDISSAPIKERLVMMNLIKDEPIAEKLKSDTYAIVGNKSNTHVILATSAGLVDRGVKPRKRMSPSKTLSISNQSKRISYTIPKEHHQELIPDHEFSKFKERKEPTNPKILIAHPHEDFAIIADKSGEVWARSFNDPSKHFFFETGQSIPCSALAVSNDGNLFGAAFGSKARLYSFFCNEDGRNLYADFDTWSEKITCMDFVKGSGIFACGQIASEQCKSAVTFWDALLPNSSAMIASVKFGKGVDPTCMDFSYLENNLIVGTNKGTVYTVDTRMFGVIHTYKAHSKEVTALKVDKGEAFCATGGIGGKLKIWNLHSSALVQSIEVPGMHSVKSIDISSDHIYVAYSDGYAQINLGQ